MEPSWYEKEDNGGPKIMLWLFIFLTIMAAISCCQTKAQTMNTIDLLFVYPPVLVATLPQPQLDAWIQAQIPPANQVFVNNELPIQLRFVGSHLAADWTVQEGILDLLRVYNPSDGIMDEVPPLRDQLGADIVVLLPTSAGPAGLAYGQIYNEVDDFSAKAYVTVRTDAYTIPYIFLHEIGHVLGCNHDIVDYPAVGTFGGRTHAFKAPDNSYFTVMTATNPYPTVPYFSSATRRMPDGRPLGNAMADCEAVLRITGPIAANFRTPPGC